MNLFRFYLELFTVMFTTTTITYAIFDEVLKGNINFFDATIQSLGLSVIFTFSIFLLEVSSNYIKVLNTKYYPIFQYLSLLFIITNYAKYLHWGDWNNKIYVFIFVFSFSLVYLFVYVMFDIRYKKEDQNLEKILKSYQNKIK